MGAVMAKTPGAEGGARCRWADGYGEVVPEGAGRSCVVRQSSSPAASWEVGGRSMCRRLHMDVRTHLAPYPKYPRYGGSVVPRSSSGHDRSQRWEESRTPRANAKSDSVHSYTSWRLGADEEEGDLQGRLGKRASGRLFHLILKDLCSYLGSYSVVAQPEMLFSVVGDRSDVISDSVGIWLGEIQ